MMPSCLTARPFNAPFQQHLSAQTSAAIFSRSAVSPSGVSRFGRPKFSGTEAEGYRLIAWYLAFSPFVGPILLPFLMRWHQKRNSVHAFILGRMKHQSKTQKLTFLQRLKHHPDYQSKPFFRYWLIDTALTISNVTPDKKLPWILDGLRDDNAVVIHRSLQGLDTLRKESGLSKPLQIHLEALYQQFPIRAKKRLPLHRVKSYLLSGLVGFFVPSRFKAPLRIEFSSDYEQTETWLRHYAIKPGRVP